MWEVVSYVSPRGPMCFRCLISNLSVPVEFSCILVLDVYRVCVYISMMSGSEHLSVSL